MGWFSRDDDPVQVDAVIDTEGYTWQCTFDEDGCIHTTVSVVVDRAICDGEVYSAYVDDYGRLIVEW
jgi:hypothetical protein